MRSIFANLFLSFIFCSFVPKMTYAQKWDSLSSGISADAITSLGVCQGQVYAGGSFVFGSNNVNLAKWNGTGWEALITNLGQSLSSVYAISEYQGTLYVGGDFTNIAGDYTLHSLVKWNGAAWAALDTGLNSGASVKALAVYNGMLYVGGYFTTAGKISTNGIASWDGTKWQALGTGITPNDEVDALTVYNGKLVAGGWFTNAGSVITNGIAQWNGTAWSKMDLGGDTLVSVPALEVFNGNLYALGTFTKAGVTANNGIAMWNGTSWNNVANTPGTGFNISNRSIASLKTYNGYLYAGGKYSVSVGPYFKTYGLVRWNGTLWDTVSSLITTPYSSLNIGAMAVWNDSLYAAGNFMTIGGVASRNIAAWNEAVPSPQLTIYTNHSSPSCYNACDGKARVHVSGGTGAYTYSWSPMGVVLDSVNSICSGKYTVYVSDASGDTATGIVYLTNPPAMQISFPQVTPAGCHHSDGSVTATVTGAGIYTYSWNTSPAQHTPQASGLASGTYTVTAINYNGCSNSASIAITDSCFFVWPGDANDDGVADNNDILAIGIGYGKSGTSRFSASTNWIGQPSADWADTLKGGINFKFIDCNGDGVINSSDTTAVIQNYGLLHNHQPMINPPFDASVPTLYLKNIPDSIAANAYGSIQLELGTATLPANTLYGLAFNIHFDPSLIDPASIRLNLNSSWMGSNGVNLIGIAKTTSSGMTGIAITRINKLNASGNGLIGKITFKTTGSLIGTMNTRETGITITDLKVISADQSLLTLNAVGDSLLVEDPRLMVGIQSSSLSTLDISLAPNPFDESTTLSIKGVNNTIDYLLYDIVGKEVRHFRSAENKVVIHKENLSQGIYLLKLFSGGQFVGKEKLIIR